MSFDMRGKKMLSSCGRIGFRPVHPSSNVSIDLKQPYAAIAAEGFISGFFRGRGGGGGDGG